MSAEPKDQSLPWYKRLTDEQREYLKTEPVKHEPSCGIEALLRDRPNLTFHLLRDPDACKHQWRGWREFDDGRGGEQVCKLCGMGAMTYSLRTAP